MKRTITEIYVEVEETLEMRSLKSKKADRQNAPPTIEQFVCPHCGRTIQQIEKLQIGESKK